MVYALGGIPLVLLVLQDLGRLLTVGLKFPWFQFKRGQAPLPLVQVGVKKGEEWTGFRRCLRYVTKQSWEEMLEIEEKERMELEIFDLPIPVAIALVIGWIFICSATFCIWERQWTYLEAFYFFFISLSTVGLGDLTPEDPRLLLMMFGYIIVGKQRLLSGTRRQTASPLDIPRPLARLHGHQPDPAQVGADLSGVSVLGRLVGRRGCGGGRWCRWGRRRRRPPTSSATPGSRPPPRGRRTGCCSTREPPSVAPTPSRKVFPSLLPCPFPPHWVCPSLDGGLSRLRKAMFASIPSLTDSVVMGAGWRGLNHPDSITRRRVDRAAQTELW